MKKALPYIAGAVLLTALLLLVFLHKEPRKFDGRITLNPKEKIPYGTYAAYQLLKQQFPAATIEINKYAPAKWQNISFDSNGQVLLIINNFFNPTLAELKHLARFAQADNYIFISSLQMNETAQRFFNTQQEDVYNPFALQQEHGIVRMHDSFAVRLDTAAYAQPVAFVYPGISYNNTFTQYDSSTAYPLGYNSNGTPNLLAINTKQGAIFLHAAPITFTNFFILYGSNHTYFEKLLRLLPQGARRIVWDEYFLLYKKDSSGDDDSKGLLHVLLSHKNFYIAGWLVIMLLALYLLTEIKRKQRMVPLYAKRTNDSLEFVTTIGKLYYEKSDHKNLAAKLTLFFFDYVRTKYKIATGEINSSFVQHLSLKTTIPAADINELMDALTTIRISRQISRRQLLQYHRLLENFYSKA